MAAEQKALLKCLDGTVIYESLELGRHILSAGEYVKVPWVGRGVVLFRVINTEPLMLEEQVPK